MVAHTLNLSIQETKQANLWELKVFLVDKQVSGQPELYGEILSQEYTNRKCKHIHLHVVLA